VFSRQIPDVPISLVTPTADCNDIHSD